MKKQLIPGIIFLFVLIISVLIYFHYSTGKVDQILKGLNKGYPPISIDQMLNGIVTDIYHGNSDIFRNNPHHAYVTLDNSLKLRINASYELSREISLDDVLKTGYRLVKSQGSDKFQLLNVQNQDTVRYTFELRDDLGYPLSKK